MGCAKGGLVGCAKGGLVGCAKGGLVGLGAPHQARGSASASRGRRRRSHKRPADGMAGWGWADVPWTQAPRSRGNPAPDCISPGSSRPARTCRYAQALQFGNSRSPVLYKGAVSEQSIFASSILSVTACAMCAVYKEERPNTAHISGPETNPTFGSKQVTRMIASELTYPVVTPKHYYSQPYSTRFEAEDLGVIVVPERFRHVFYDTELTGFAGMAVNDPVAAEGLFTTDCGATTTLTDSLFNMTNVEPKMITIQ